MSQQNVEVIRAVYDRFGSGDFRDRAAARAAAGLPE